MKTIRPQIPFFTIYFYLFVLLTGFLFWALFISHRAVSPVLAVFLFIMFSVYNYIVLTRNFTTIHYNSERIQITNPLRPFSTEHFHIKDLEKLELIFARGFILKIHLKILKPRRFGVHYIDRDEINGFITEVNDILSRHQS